MNLLFKLKILLLQLLQFRLAFSVSAQQLVVFGDYFYHQQLQWCILRTVEMKFEDVLIIFFDITLIVRFLSFRLFRRLSKKYSISHRDRWIVLRLQRYEWFVIANLFTWLRWGLIYYFANQARILQPLFLFQLGFIFRKCSFINVLFLIPTKKLLFLVDMGYYLWWNFERFVFWIDIF